MVGLRLGAVAYDPKVVTIWEGFRAWFAGQGLAMDYVLFSNYEAQVEAHLAGTIDVAWNSPLAWVRMRRAAAARGEVAVAVAMRDSDRDLRTLVVARAGDGVAGVADLRGKTVGVGALDSPQATLLPLSFLRACGLRPGEDVAVRRFDVLAGKHGDHIGGERDAARALAAGEVDAHLRGAVDVAWNSPLAWVRTRRAAAAREDEAVAVAMRDTDRDLRSL
ncbi:MAG TPA: PhnD/SsuA/transferrin family substrate-binding protein, partial [Candidatus Dormibacteraeota bacterium]|nr:PhnD/SsuA/transferrin family substrate-binding protein [Candidatus Dormibacteraeota bacterium]